MRPRSTNSSNVTIIDVAKQAGVSYSTVSRVLNDEAYVKESTRVRVNDAIERLGYVVNQQARSLRGSKTNTIGLIVRDLGTEYMGAIARGIDSHLVGVGYDLMLYTTHDREDKEATYVGMMTRGMVDGLLLVIPRDGHLYLDDLRSQGFPHVIIDDAMGNEASPAVLADNFQGAYEATAHLIGNGHRHIGFITGHMEICAAIDRLAGYKAALKEHSLPISTELIAFGDFFHHSGYNAGMQLFAQKPQPTAIIASNDVMAFGVMEAAREMGLLIPANLSLVGFDDVPQAVTSYPSMTTVRQPLEEMGRNAAQMLLGHISDSEAAVKRHKFPTKLIVRESTSPLSR